MVKIKSILVDKLEKIDIVDIQVIKNPSQDQYIVGDETGFIVLRCDQILKVKSNYKLIKPKYNDLVMHKNPKFAAIKIEKKIKINKISDETEKQLMSLIDT